MKKFLAVVLCVALMSGIVGVVVAGCGTSRAQTVIDDARNALSQAQTFRFRGLRTLNGTEYPVAGEAQQVGDALYQHIVMEVEQGQIAEYYMMGDRIYINLAGNWYFDDSAGQLDQPGNSQGLSKRDLDEMLKAAKDAKITAEDGATTTVSLTVGKGYTDIISRQLKDAQAQGLMTEENLNASLNYLKNMSISMALSYNADAGQVQHVERNVEIKTSDISWSTGENLDFIDYGADVQINLPAEAANAQSWSAYLQQLQQQAQQQAQQQTGQ